MQKSVQLSVDYSYVVVGDELPLMLKGANYIMHDSLDSYPVLLQLISLLLARQQVTCICIAAGWQLYTW